MRQWGNRRSHALLVEILIGTIYGGEFCYIWPVYVCIYLFTQQYLSEIYSEHATPTVMKMYIHKVFISTLFIILWHWQDLICPYMKEQLYKLWHVHRVLFTCKRKEWGKNPWTDGEWFSGKRMSVLLFYKWIAWFHQREKKELAQTILNIFPLSLMTKRTLNTYWTPVLF